MYLVLPGLQRVKPRESYETLNNLEIGYRRTAEELSFELNYYYMDYNNQLVLTGDVNDVGASIRTNVPDSYRMGLEASALWKISNKIAWNAIRADIDELYSDAELGQPTEPSSDAVDILADRLAAVNSATTAAFGGNPLGSDANFTFANAKGSMFLGRGFAYPIAMEGALKLKELCYVHAEGYPAGEMKHGPLALIEEGIPVVVLAPRDKYYEKIRSNQSNFNQHVNGSDLQFMGYRA